MKSCFIDQLGGILGVRDTRRVIGEYTVTYEDSQQGPAFSDSVAANTAISTAISCLSAA